MEKDNSLKKNQADTKDSRYSVEYTMDVAAKAGQDSMPAGLARVLELLGNSLNIDKMEEFLWVNSKNLFLVNGQVELAVIYKNSHDQFDPQAILVNGKPGTEDHNMSLFTLTTAGEYTVKAGGKEVKVVVQEKSCV